MALEPVVDPSDLLIYGCKESFSWEGVTLSYSLGVKEEEEGVDDGAVEILEKNIGEEAWLVGNQESAPYPDSPITEVPVLATTSRKPRKTRSRKNKKEVENRRITHIVVERNRRKQMNEYLAILHSLMPPSYVHRSDQASIIGGAINFVKELEQLLQSLEAKKKIKQRSNYHDVSSSSDNFFNFPHFSSCSTHSSNSTGMKEWVTENHSSIGDIEVTMVESHANLKVLSRRRPKQMLKMVSGFQNLHLTVLHLNVTTVEETVLYSFSIKVEDSCHLRSVDEIATAVQQMLHTIQAEATTTST